MTNNAGMKAWLRSLSNVPVKWRRRTGTERRLLIEALLLLSVARLALLVLPFKWLAVTLGRHREETGTELNSADLCCSRMVGQAVCTSANYTPWKSVCLPQAVAAKWMLQRRHIACTLYLGVAKTEAAPMELAAHAWLRCGTLILTGRENYTQFTVVATFS
jgi:hypothetical protein